MKFVVYYTVPPRHDKISRSYPDYPVGTDVKKQWSIEPGNYGKRKYVQHEPHDGYTNDFAKAGMVGADEDDVRDWLMDRCEYLNDLAKNAAAQQQARIIPANPNVYGTAKPGDIVRDQHGRSGRVPEVPLEVFRNKPIDPDAAMDAVRAAGKGGGAHVPPVKGN